MAKSRRLLKNNLNFTLRFTFWKYVEEWITISIFNLSLLLLRSIVWDFLAQMSWWYIQITCSFSSYFNCISTCFLLQEKKEKKRKRSRRSKGGKEEKSYFYVDRFGIWLTNNKGNIYDRKVKLLSCVRLLATPWIIYKYIYIIYICITQPQKGWNSVTYSSVNEYREYYTWWNKSDLEKQMLYNISQSWNLKNNISKYIQQTKKTHDKENKLVVPEGRRKWGQAS